MCPYQGQVEGVLRQKRRRQRDHRNRDQTDVARSQGMPTTTKSPKKHNWVLL